MRIILSSAKKMIVDTDKLEYQGRPVFMEQTTFGGLKCADA